MKSTHSRCIIQMKMSLLDTLTMVSLRIRQSKQTLLQKFTGHNISK